MNRYLVVTELQGPPAEEGGSPYYSERVYESYAQDPEAAAQRILEPLQLQPGWTVQRVRVYVLAGEDPPLAVLVRPAPQWVLV